MRLLLFQPLRGHRGSVADAVARARQGGFDGIEGTPPAPPEERLLFQELLQEAELAYIGEACAAGPDQPDPAVSPKQHLLDLRAGIERCLDLSPLLINARVGLDAWSPELQAGFFHQILELEAEYRVDIAVETLRGRPTFSPWSTRALLAQVPGLKLTGDFGQWCAVAGRLVLEDDARLLRDIGGQCWHLHATVGDGHGPQVPDPRAADAAEALEAHLRWWEAIWSRQAQRGLEAITMTPGFQPSPRLPMADPWELNRWMAATLRGRFDLWQTKLPGR